MFVENLKRHDASDGVARIAAGHREEALDRAATRMSRSRWRSEQFLPFVNGYEFFDKMGVRIYDNGHSYSGFATRFIPSTRRSASTSG
jgi:hypothetical protein